MKLGKWLAVFVCVCLSVCLSVCLYWPVTFLTWETVASVADVAGRSRLRFVLRLVHERLIVAVVASRSRKRESFESF